MSRDSLPYLLKRGIIEVRVEESIHVGGIPVNSLRGAVAGPEDSSLGGIAFVNSLWS